MDNQEFDKIWSEKLKEEQDFAYRAADWEAVAERLTPPDKGKRRFGLWIWFIPLAFLGLGATCCWLALQLKKSNDYLQTFQQTIANLEQIQFDTTVQTVTIIKYDTIVKTFEHIVNKTNDKTTFIEQDQTSSLKQIDIFSSFNKTPTLQLLNDPSIFGTNNLIVKNSLHYQLSRYPSNNINTTPRSIALPDKLTHIVLDIPTISFDKIDFHPEQIVPDYLMDVPVLTTVLKPRVRKFSIGVIAGTAWPGKYSENNSYSTSETVNKTGWEVGLHFSYQINTNWLINAQFLRQQLNYQSLQPTLVWGVHHEYDLIAASSNNTFEFNNNQSSFIYQIGGNYLFTPRKTLCPYVGFMAAARSTVKQSANIRFQLAYNDISFRESSVNTAGFKIYGLQPTIGIQLDGYKKMSWRLEGWYQFNINESIQQMYTPFGVRTIVGYRF